MKVHPRQDGISVRNPVTGEILPPDQNFDLPPQPVWWRLFHDGDLIKAPKIDQQPPQDRAP